MTSSRVAEIIAELFKPEDFQRPAVAAVAFGAVLAADSQDVGRVFQLLAEMLRPGEQAIYDPWIPRALRFMHSDSDHSRSLTLSYLRDFFDSREGKGGSSTELVQLLQGAADLLLQISLYSLLKKMQNEEVDQALKQLEAGFFSLRVSRDGLLNNTPCHHSALSQ